MKQQSFSLNATSSVFVFFDKNGYLTNLKLLNSVPQNCFELNRMNILLCYQLNGYAEIGRTSYQLPPYSKVIERNENVIRCASTSEYIDVRFKYYFTYFAYAVIIVIDCVLLLQFQVDCTSKLA